MCFLLSPTLVTCVQITSVHFLYFHNAFKHQIQNQPDASALTIACLPPCSTPPLLHYNKPSLLPSSCVCVCLWVLFKTKTSHLSSWCLSVNWPTLLFTLNWPQKHVGKFVYFLFWSTYTSNMFYVPFISKSDEQYTRCPGLKGKGSCPGVLLWCTRSVLVWAQV